MVCSAIFQISANIVIQWFSSAATPRNLFNKEQMAKSVENSFLQFLQKVWQFLWKAGGASCWNLKCVFLSFPLIGHSCQKHFLHTAWFMSCVSMDTSDESGPFQPPLHRLYRKSTIFCLQLCRKCTFSVHFCALLYRQRPACQLHVWVFLTKGMKVHHLK